MNRLQQLGNKAKVLSGHAGFRKYFFNTGWLFGEKIVRMIAGVFVGAYVARYLDPSGYGLLNYVISLVTIFTPIAWLGLEAIVMKAIVENEELKDKILGTAFVLKFTAATILFGLIVLTSSLTSQEPQNKWLFIAVGCGVFAESFGAIQYFFQAKSYAKYVVISQLVALVIISCIRIVLVVTHAPLIWFALAYSLDLFLQAFGFIYFYTFKFKSLKRWTFDKEFGKDLLRQSWPLIIGSISVTLYMKVDQVMIKWMLGDKENGIYSVAVRLSELWNFIPMAICGSLFPALLNAKMNSQLQYQKRLQRLYDLMVFLSVAIAIPMTFLSPWIVALLFGKSYQPAAPVLALYIWSAVFVFLGVANSRAMISEGLQKLRMTMLIIASLSNIVLNYILIQWIGLTGAAVSTLVSYSIAGYWGLLFSRRTRSMFISCSKSLNIFGLGVRLVRYIKANSEDFQKL